MLGSSNSISCANIHLNAAVAEVLRQFSDELEQSEDFNSALHELIRRTIKNHKRIIFNGNGYDKAWIVEAEKRGLLNLKTTADAMPKTVSAVNFVTAGIISLRAISIMVRASIFTAFT